MDLSASSLFIIEFHVEFKFLVGPYPLPVELSYIYNNYSTSHYKINLYKHSETDSQNFGSFILKRVIPYFPTLKEETKFLIIYCLFEANFLIFERAKFNRSFV